MLRHAQLCGQPLAVELVGEHPVNDRAQQRALVQRRPARNAQLGVAVLGQHGRQRLDDGVQVFQRVVALGQQQHRRGGKIPRMPQRTRVKQRAQRLVAGVVAGVGGQRGAGGAVKRRAARHIAGVGQHRGLLCGQCVKARLHIVEQLAGNDFVNGVPQRTGTAVFFGHAVAEVCGAVPHNTLYAEQHGQA